MLSHINQFDNGPVANMNVFVHPRLAARLQTASA